MTIKSAPYGRDTSATDHVRYGRVVSGARLLAEAAYRRLTTKRGTLLSAPNYGLDIVEMLGTEVSLAVEQSFASRITNELRKDVRFETVLVQITKNIVGVAVEWIIDIEIVASDATSFELSIGVAGVSASLLKLPEAA